MFPRSGFRIAFDLIDISEEGKIVKEEFATFCKIGLKRTKSVNEENGEKLRENTFLSLHFFGKMGTRPLTFEEFQTFVQDFQTEMLQVEFLEHSKGHSVEKVKIFSQCGKMKNSLPPKKCFVKSTL